jgi:bifunctional DNA-binding transcriptional regulator/antitoxin component of YhaV-PrlF toxin-antitoxin module
MPHEIERETTVTERFSVTIPPAVRRAAGVEAGDMIRWQADDDGSLSVELQRQQYGAFDDLNAIDIGESTDVADEMDTEAVDFD